MNPGDIIQRGERATQLLNEPLLMDAFKALEAIYTAELRKCAPGDDLGRFRYARAIDVIDGVKLHLRDWMARGQLTAKQSQEFRDPATLKERVIRVF